MYTYTHFQCLAIASICMWKPVWSLLKLSQMYSYKTWIYMPPPYNICSLKICWKLMEIKHGYQKWSLFKKAYPSTIPLHICWVSVFHEIASFALPVDTTAMGRSLRPPQMVKSRDLPPRSFGRKLLMIQNQSRVAPVNFISRSRKNNLGGGLHQYITNIFPL